VPHPLGGATRYPPASQTATYSQAGCAWVLPPAKVDAQEVKQWELEDRFRSASTNGMGTCPAHNEKA